MLPSKAGFIVLLDAGANADARPEHLLQFAVMGRLFAQGVLGDPAPRVGLLSIGEEEGRGSELIQQATPLLRDTPGFVGNVEGRDIPRGTARVVVTDGFTGNVALKLYEASGEFLFSEIRAALSETLAGRLGGLLVRPSIRRMRHRLDPETVGGAVLLGVQGLAVIGHGSGEPHGRGQRDPHRRTRRARGRGGTSGHRAGHPTGVRARVGSRAETPGPGDVRTHW